MMSASENWKVSWVTLNSLKSATKALAELESTSPEGPLIVVIVGVTVWLGEAGVTVVGYTRNTSPSSRKQSKLLGCFSTRRLYCLPEVRLPATSPTLSVERVVTVPAVIWSALALESTELIV